MQLIDSHCHLDLMDLSVEPEGVAGVLSRAQSAQVTHCLCVSVELAGFDAMAQLTAAHPNVSLSVGMHPTHACDTEPTVEDLTTLAQHPRVVAIGETGLDDFHDSVPLATQSDRFRTHIQAAIASQLPLIVHTRAARDATIAILREAHAERAGGVLHCFTEDWDTAKAACDLGFYISFSGILTFKNAKEIQEVAQKLPLDRILIETDAPYLAPVPYRGKANEPAHVQYVAQKLAELRGISLEVVAEQTTHNFYTLFKAAQPS